MRILADSHFRSETYALERSVRADADRVAELPGYVYCNDKVVCRVAGKPLVVDDFKVEQMVATRAFTQPQLDQILRSRNIITFKSGG
jgi:hypothetical protein